MPEDTPIRVSEADAQYITARQRQEINELRSELQRELNQQALELQYKIRSCIQAYSWLSREKLLEYVREMLKDLKGDG